MPRHPIYALSSTIVDELCALRPDEATYLGIAGHDDRWPDLSPAGHATIAAKLSDLRGQVDAVPPPGSRWDVLAIEVARSMLDEELDAIAVDDHLRSLNSIASPPQAYREIFDHMSRDTAEAWDNIVTRLTTLEQALADYRASLDLGIERGLAVAARQVEAVIEQANVMASDESPFLALGESLAAELPGHVDLADRLEAAIAAGRRAFGGFADYLRSAYLPNAIVADAVGEARYVREAARFLGTTIEPAETYAWGWSEVADLRTRMEAVAAEIAPGGTVAHAVQVLKTDPSRLAPDRESFVRIIQERERAALEQLSGTHFDVPDTIRDVTVKLAGPGASLGAYYVGPSEDFTRPGSVWWSLEGDGPFPLYDEITTAYHEGFPGHHLQVGVQMSHAEQLSRLQRLWVWKSGTGEGWALYAERLMEELGYLDSPDYVFGWLAAQMLRACRVVIDIGSHLGYPIPKGQPFHPGEQWSYETATQMLVDYATLEPAYAASEVTRYFGWPGQAISYKVGEQTILDTRDELMATRRADFDLKAFHADLLGVGPVGIDLMRRFLLD
jgi:uncharacterized protein (DUF885 family)